jgi:iron complex outermembrane recepter protein
MSVRIAVIAALGISTSALAYPVAALADDSPATSNDKLDEIVVTAQRRSEDIEKVPIAISAVSGNALTNANITNVQELGNSVPGLNIENNVGNAFVFVRGIGTTALAVENDVGVYVDGVYITSQAASLLNLSNIDHVEVLKGPQGTLFGRNAIGGALSIVTKDPSQTPSADISVGYANYDTTTANFYGTTGIGDHLATDLAFYYSNQADGWGNNFTNGLPTFRARTIQLRNKWVYTPTDDTKITLSLDYALVHNELGASWHFLPGAYGIDGVSTYRGFYNALGNGLSQNENQQDGGMVRIDQNFGWARGVSITSVRGSTNHNFIDQDATPLPIVEGGPTPQNDKSYSEELQLLSPESSKITWIAGAYYLYDKYYTPGFTIQEGPTQVVLTVKEPTKSYAEFGQASIEVLPATRITAGLRYTHDDKSVAGTTAVDGETLPPVIPGMTSPSSQQETFTRYTYRAVLDHQFTPDIMGYVSYDTGFKSGQYNLISYAAPAVKPESLDAWQAGVKSEFLDQRLRVNLSVFHYNYSNIQITQVVTGGTELLNAAAAKLYGVDLDFNALVTSDFKVQGAVSWMHGKYTDFPNAPSYVPALSPVTGLPVGANTLETIDATDKTTVHSPDVTAFLAGDYTVPSAVGPVEFNTSLSYNSGYFWDPDNRLKQPSYTLLGAFVKWTPFQKNYDVRIWGSNLTNKEYYAYEAAFSLGDVASPAPPRTYGVTVSAHF